MFAMCVFVSMYSICVYLLDGGKERESVCVRARVCATTLCHLSSLRDHVAISPLTPRPVAWSPEPAFQNDKVCLSVFWYVQRKPGLTAGGGRKNKSHNMPTPPRSPAGNQNTPTPPYPAPPPQPLPTNNQLTTAALTVTQQCLVLHHKNAHTEETTG